MYEIELIIAISAVAALTAAIPATFFMARRQKAQAKEIAFQSVRAAHEAMAAPLVLEAVEAADRRQNDAMSEAMSELRQIRAEVEWLSGERMIDQAVNLARDGLDASFISRETGLTMDDAETISRFRRH